MIFKTQYLILFASLCACSAAPVTNDLSTDVVLATDVAKNPAAFDGKYVAIEGYLMMNLLRSPMFFLTKDDAVREAEENTIDLYPVSDEVHDKIMFENPTCVVARGNFETYTHGKMAIGANSATGAFHIESFTLCSSKK